MQQMLFEARQAFQAHAKESVTIATPPWVSEWHVVWSQIVAGMYPYSFRVMQGVIGASGASAHLERSCGATWAQLGPHRTNTGTRVLTGIIQALSWPFGRVMLRDVMLDWVHSQPGLPRSAVDGDRRVDSDSSDLGGLDPEAWNRAICPMS